MADRELWRKNLPEDFDGRHADVWDGEVPMKPIIWSTVAIAISVLVAFVFCWGLIVFFEGNLEEPTLSPIAEANERRLPPQPWVQPKPEVEMDELREQLAERMSGYGWSDQLEGMVHIPVEEAKEIVLASAGALPVSVEPAADQPVDVEAEVADEADGGGER
ncbi:MAG: hypothetical protein AAFY88_01680 [Acidobacteriota bacterium]